MKKSIVSKDYKLVKLGTDSVIFEDGYWMDRKDYDYVYFGAMEMGEMRVPVKEYITFDINKETKKITYSFLLEIWY